MRVRKRRVQVDWRVLGIAVLIGVAVFLSGIVIDVLLRVRNREILYSDVFTSCVAAHWRTRQAVTTPMPDRLLWSVCRLRPK